MILKYTTFNIISLLGSIRRLGSKTIRFIVSVQDVHIPIVNYDIYYS